jgi:NhaA family Na+:H+ antiporter
MTGANEELAGPPPEAWRPAHRAAERIVGPVTRFLHIEAASAAVLAIAAVAALVLANSRWASTYAAILATPISLSIGPWSATFSFRLFVDDGLMTLFFFVVGLEIRREMFAGELADLRRASLPIAAALGGMLAPALLYLAFNPTGPTQRGWGVPMATDIAFALAALAVLGKRVPPALRVLLLALAILDDIGGVLVIAFFYSGGLGIVGLAVAAGGVIVTFGMQRVGVRNVFLYLIPGAVVWLGMLYAGVHPTMAGVTMGLLTPARAWLGPQGLVRASERVLAIDRDPGRAVEDAVGTLSAAEREVFSPAQRLQLLLHPWVAFVAMPVFAFANAGIAPQWAAVDVRVAVGVVVGLVLGKPLGIVLVSWVAVRSGLSRLPTGVGWAGVAVVGVVAGVGFTVALFIANLAFVDAIALESAKIGILCGSVLAAVAAFALGRLALRKDVGAGVAATAEEAESSAER